MRRVLAVLIGVVAVFGAMAPSGAAPEAEPTTPSPHVRTDPVGTEAVYQRNDVRSIRIAHYQASVSLSFSTQVGVNPATHPAWRVPDGKTAIIWTLNSSEGGPPYYIGMRSSATGPTEATVTSPLYPPCDAVFSFDAPRRYVITFARSCIGSPVGVRAQLRYRYDPPGPDPRRGDLAPNRGTTASVLWAPCGVGRPEAC